MDDKVIEEVNSQGTDELRDAIFLALNLAKTYNYPRVTWVALLGAWRYINEVEPLDDYARELYTAEYMSLV